MDIFCSSINKIDEDESKVIYDKILLTYDTGILVPRIQPESLQDSGILVPRIQYRLFGISQREIPSYFINFSRENAMKLYKKENIGLLELLLNEASKTYVYGEGKRDWDAVITTILIEVSREYTITGDISLLQNILHVVNNNSFEYLRYITYHLLAVLATGCEWYLNLNEKSYLDIFSLLITMLTKPVLNTIITTILTIHDTMLDPIVSRGCIHFIKALNKIYDLNPHHKIYILQEATIKGYPDIIEEILPSKLQDKDKDFNSIYDLAKLSVELDKLDLLIMCLDKYNQLRKEEEEKKEDKDYSMIKTLARLSIELDRRNIVAYMLKTYDEGTKMVNLEPYLINRINSEDNTNEDESSEEDTNSP